MQTSAKSHKKSQSQNQKHGLRVIYQTIKYNSIYFFIVIRLLVINDN